MWSLGIRRQPAVGRGVKCVGRYGLAIQEVAVHDPGDGVLVQPAIPGALGVDHHYRAQVAGVQAASAGGEDMSRAMVQARVLQPPSQPGAQPGCTGGSATRPLAEQHMVGMGRDDGPIRVGRSGIAAAGDKGSPGLQGPADGLPGGLGQTTGVVERRGKNNSRRNTEAAPANGEPGSGASSAWRLPRAGKPGEPRQCRRRRAGIGPTLRSGMVPPVRAGPPSPARRDA